MAWSATGGLTFGFGHIPGENITKAVNPRSQVAKETDLTLILSSDRPSTWTIYRGANYTGKGIALLVKKIGV